MPKITIVTFEGSMGEVVNYHRLVSRPYAQGRNPRNLRALNNAHTWTRELSEHGSQENIDQSGNAHEIQLETNVGQTTNAESSVPMSQEASNAIDDFTEIDSNARSVATVRVNVPILSGTVESSNIASQMENVSIAEGNIGGSRSRKRH